MSNIDNQQLRAFAAQYGTIVGLMWIVSFSFFIIGLTQPLLGNLSMLFGLLSIYVAISLVRKFRRDITPLNFWQAWRMSSLIYSYAALLMAVAQFIYFQYIDDGLLISTYIETMNKPEVITMMQSMMPGEDLKSVSQQAVDMLKSITPIQLTIELLIYNLFLGVLLTIPTAGFSSVGRKR